MKERYIEEIRIDKEEINGKEFEEVKPVAKGRDRQIRRRKREEDEEDEEGDVEACKSYGSFFTLTLSLSFRKKSQYSNN